MEISASILTFKGTLTEPATEYLHFTNSTAEPMAFKVKTTAPKLYCVRPNANIVQPGESMKISIILQGFTQPLPKDFKCKDKFLIVSVPCSKEEEAGKVGENWASLESKNKEKLLQKKLKVQFIIEDEDADESRINDTSFANATQSGAAPAEPVEIASKSVKQAGDDVEKELADSTTKINTLSEKLDSNAATSSATEKSVPVVAAEEPVSGISLPFAVLLVFVALLLGWYFF